MEKFESQSRNPRYRLAIRYFSLSSKNHHSLLEGITRQNILWQRITTSNKNSKLNSLLISEIINVGT